jgi:hypothetical protein
MPVSLRKGPLIMLSTEDLFVYVYVFVDDAIKAGEILIPPRPGPAPACTDAEIVTICLVGHLKCRRSESGWLAEVRADWHFLFPHLPHQSEVNRRIRWLWGAFEQLRAQAADTVPTDAWQQIDTSGLPVMHPSRVRGPNSWTGPGDLVARFGWDAAHAEWFYGFRLAIRTDLDSRLVRAWSIVPAAVNERDVADDLLADHSPPAGLLLDRGFVGKAFAARQAQRGTQVVLAPSRAQRQTIPAVLRRPVAVLRNRVETTFGQVTDYFDLARHGAHTFWGLLTRTAATLCAHTLYLVLGLQPT